MDLIHEIYEKEYKKRIQDEQIGWSEDYEEQYRIIERWKRKKCFPSEGKLLEVGCGAGNISLWYAKNGYEVHGVDISETAINWARRNASKEGLEINFRVGNILNLKELDKEQFDIVVDGSCFHCIIGIERKNFLKSIWRLLVKGGILYIRTMCGLPRDEKIMEKFDERNRLVMMNGIATRYLGEGKEIRKEIRKGGFEELEWEELRENQEQDILVGVWKKLG